MPVRSWNSVSDQKMWRRRGKLLPQYSFCPVLWKGMFCVLLRTTVFLYLVMHKSIELTHIRRSHSELQFMLSLSFVLVCSKGKKELFFIKESNINYENNQQDAIMYVNLLFIVSSTCFGRCFRPSSGTLDFIYSI